MSNESIIRDLLIEGVEDWVPIDTLIGLANESEKSEGGNFKEIVASILDYLLKDDLMVAGEIGNSGFEAWAGDADSIARRIIARLDEVDWRPFGGVCWLANTSKGDNVER